MQPDGVYNSKADQAGTDAICVVDVRGDQDKQTQTDGIKSSCHLDISSDEGDDRFWVGSNRIFSGVVLLTSSRKIPIPYPLINVLMIEKMVGCQRVATFLTKALNVSPMMKW